MKLQGKNTGTFANFVGYIDQTTPTIDLPTGNTMLTVRYKDAGVNCYKDYKTIADFNADWEDYEEPKEFWFINDCGDVLKYKYDGGCYCPILSAKRIGNYFETKEEAEKAVEKLKAWEILRENQVHFDLATLADETTVTIFARKNGAIHEFDKELFLLFGGEDVVSGEEKE